RGGDDGARGVREQPRHVGHPRLVTGMQQVVALAGQAVPAQLREAGRAPDVGRNAPVALEEIGRRDHFAQDRARTEQLRARTLPALASGRLVLADVAAQPIHPPDDAFLVAYDQPRLGVVLVHHGDVEVDVLLPADHALEAVVEDHRQLVSEGRVVGDAVGYLARQDVAVAVLVLQALAVERGPPGRAPEQEAARLHVAGRPGE